MRSPIGNGRFPYLIEFVEYILRIIIVSQYEGVINVAGAILRGKILEDPDWQDIKKYQK